MRVCSGPWRTAPGTLDDCRSLFERVQYLPDIACQ